MWKHTAFVIPGSDPEEWHRGRAVNGPEDGIHLNDWYPYIPRSDSGFQIKSGVTRGVLVALLDTSMRRYAVICLSITYPVTQASSINRNYGYVE